MSEPIWGTRGNSPVIAYEARPRGVSVLIILGFVALILFAAYTPHCWNDRPSLGPKVQPYPCCCGINRSNVGAIQDRYSMINISQDMFSLTSHRDLDLLLVIHSLPARFTHRQAIRETWAGSHALHASPLKIQPVFFTGKSMNSEIMEKLFDEATASNDMVVLNMWEDDSNFTIKSIAMLAWVDSHCPNLRFLMKLDDDSFLNFNMLEKFLEYATHNRTAIFGHVRQTKPRLNQTQRRKLPRWNSPSVIADPTYIVTGDAIRRLCRCCLLSYLLPQESITSQCARQSGIRLLDEPTMFSKRESIQSCNFTRFIAIDDVSPPAMRYAWEKRHFMQKLCPPNSKEDEFKKKWYSYTID